MDASKSFPPYLNRSQWTINNIIMSQHNVTRHESNIHLTRESTSAHLRHRQVERRVYVGHHVLYRASKLEKIIINDNNCHLHDCLSYQQLMYSPHAGSYSSQCSTILVWMSSRLWSLYPALGYIKWYVNTASHRSSNETIKPANLQWSNLTQ